MNEEKRRRIDWVEKSGKENLHFRLQNAETLAREAQQTLTVLLAGTGAALAYVVKTLESGMPTAVGVGVAALAIWLMLASGVLVIKCIISRDLPVPANEPDNLWQEGWSEEMDRMGELKGIQIRIGQVRERNRAVAYWLDRVRLMSVGSPLIFVIAAAAWAAH